MGISVHSDGKGKDVGEGGDRDEWRNMRVVEEDGQVRRVDDI